MRGQRHQKTKRDRRARSSGKSVSQGQQQKSSRQQVDDERQRRRATPENRAPTEYKCSLHSHQGNYQLDASFG
jgi:hypothetical protein